MNDIYTLAKLHYKLVPITAGGKSPLIKNWIALASDDPEQLQIWESQFYPCNWAVLVGQSGLLVLDIDPRHGGDTSWEQISRPHPEIRTAMCITGGGGLHIYFRAPSADVHNTQLAPGIDIRGYNGAVVVPPSIHASGKKYTWKYSPWDVPPIDVPQWLLKLLQKKKDANEIPAIGDALITGQRNDTLYHHALLLARQGATREFIVHTLNTWRENTDPSFEYNELCTLIDSAIKKAKESKTMYSVPRRTDSDNADKLIDNYHSMLHYAPGIGWYVWNGIAWIDDSESAAVTNLATQTMIDLRDSALDAAKDPATFKEAMATAAWATSSLNISRLNAMVKLASTRPIVRIQAENLDSYSSMHLLNTPKGVIHLQTKQVLAHDPSYNITKITRVAPEEGPCPFWLRTLDLAVDGNQQLIDYIQLAIGYSLTGSLREQCLFICWGEHGNNGKSTILETLQWILGSYAQMSDMKVITSQDMDNRVSSSLAKLMGVRMVSMNEAEEHQKLSESLIKQLTGGDTIQACKKFHEPFEYMPQFKLWIRTNEKPIIHGVSEAIWRRIKLIPFVRPIPASERLGRDEVNERLRAEAGQILSWCIEGAYKWYSQGLSDPPDVAAATQEYRTDMDIVQLFFNECVIESPHKTITRTNLYQAFSYWCKEQGIRYVMSAEAFGKRVGKRLNVRERVKINGQYIWSGIDITDHAKGYIL